MMSSICLEPEGSSSGMLFYVRLRYVMLLNKTQRIVGKLNSTVYKIFVASVSR